mmetsp:Transcript_71144/g.206022  ORF Transcript_71144/g.206022 Transcript_71144/m.206022 type:complete len:235 (-) Transcript_71144:242-946(-)
MTKMASKDGANRQSRFHFEQIHLVIKFAKCLVGLLIAWFYRYITHVIFAIDNLIDNTDSDPVWIFRSVEDRFNRVSTLIITVGSNGNEDCSIVHRAVGTPNLRSSHRVWSHACPYFQGLLSSKLFLVVKRRAPKPWNHHLRLMIAWVNNELKIILFVPSGNGPVTIRDLDIACSYIALRHSFLFLHLLFSNGHIVGTQTGDVQVVTQKAARWNVRKRLHGFHKTIEIKAHDHQA